MAENYDETLGRAKNLRHLNKHRDVINKLKNETRFDRDELEKLFIVHLKISLANSGSMNIAAFHEFCYNVLGITDEMHTEKIYQIFNPNFSKNISPESFARNLSAMLKGSLYEQIHFVWKVYSQNGVLTRDAAMACMKKAIIKRKGDAGYEPMVKVTDFYFCKTLSDHQVRSHGKIRQDLVSYLLKKLDRDADGIVSYADFIKSIEANPLLLECLGPCLPDPESAVAFLNTISSRPNPVRVLPWDIRRLDDRVDILNAD